MKLIGAGLPRTATLTQKVALEMLGFGPCYHMVNVLGNLDLVPQWQAALDGNADWDTIFDGFQSTVDWPGSYYYRELTERYPDAKVLLSVRPPEKWEHSMMTTIADLHVGDSVMTYLSLAAERLNPKWRAYNDMMRDMWTRFGAYDGRGGTNDLQPVFTRYNDEVKGNVPPDRLLVWEATDGWEPLCEFLGVDVPSDPLPRLNDSETFAKRVDEMSVATVNEWWQQQQAADGAAVGAGH